MDAGHVGRQPGQPVARRFSAPRPLTVDWDWQRHGRCRGVPSEVFFSEDQPRDLRRRRESQAKAICSDCPVLSQCREYAIRAPEKYGVWGALSPRDRERIRRRVSGLQRRASLRTV